MSTNISSIADHVDQACHSKRCNSGECVVNLTNLPSSPNRLIIKMDCDELKITPGGKRCDYIIFLDFNNRNDSIVIVPIEMKSGKIHGITNIVQQIESGIKAAQQWIGNNTSTTFFPVLVHNGIHSHNRTKLKDAMIQIDKNKKSKLILMKCGDFLINKLRQNKKSNKNRT